MMPLGDIDRNDDALVEQQIALREREVARLTEEFLELRFPIADFEINGP